MTKVQKCEATLNGLRVSGLTLGRSGKIGDNQIGIQLRDGSKIVSTHLIIWNKKTLNYDVK